tara:strand:- start:6065 stop:6511 length:447 start_codon:yes stop_codon:yes gene_type:complete
MCATFVLDYPRVSRYFFRPVAWRQGGRRFHWQEILHHIAPWKSVYKILLLTESEITFVLTSGGHNAGIVSEPDHKGRTYQIATVPNTAHYKPPGQWEKTTSVTEGLWCDAWEPWLVGHGGDKIKPPSMGDNKDYAPIRDAPGKYVLMK